MKDPIIQNTVHDKNNNVTINFAAYRRLTPQEVAEQIALFRSKPKNCKLKNKTVTIITVIGAND